MNYRAMLLDVGVIVVCYLIASIPLASAVQIKVIFGGTTYAQVDYEPTAGLNVDFAAYDDEVPHLWSDSKIKINITVENGTQDSVIEKGYLYACKGLDSKTCVDSVSPVEFDSGLHASLKWVGVRDKDSSDYGNDPEVARFLIFCRVIENGKARWTGISYTVKRTAYNMFYDYTYNVQEAELYAKEYGYVNSIRTFIETTGMIAFNPDWVEKIVFIGVDRVYEMRTDGPKDFSTSVNQNGEVSSLDKDYDFVFPESGDKVFNAITLNKNPSYICGDGKCETSLGESSVNCCLDCGCLSGYYCDAVGGCRNENLITLSSGTQNLYVGNCFEDHTVDVNLNLHNAPGDVVISSASYSIGGGEWKPSQCTHVSGELYTCSIVVEKLADCGPGSHQITQNRFSMTIKYTDAGSERTKTLSTDLPDIVIGSYECGNGVCECGLGENWHNCLKDCSYVCGNKIRETDSEDCYRSETAETCCYDASCDFGYCDVERKDAPETGVCRNDPQESDVSVYLESGEFTGHSSSGGQNVNLVVNISNSPRTLALWNERCEADCRYNGDYTCEAECTIDCGEGYVDKDRQVFSAACQMNFKIKDYDTINEYTVSPVINFSIGYYNGSEYVSRSVSVSAGNIRVNPSSCGDGVCAPTIEDPSICCYDCGCPAGEYCDTADRGGPSEGDSCQSIEGISLVVDSIVTREFDDAARQNVVNISAHIPARPSGLSVDPSCVIAGGVVECHAVCEEKPSSDGSYNMSCRVYIRPVDYRDEGADFYDEQNHVITLPDNWFNVTIKFNNGSRVAERKFSESIGDIRMDVIWHCGDGSCQQDLGESRNNCCIDCECGEGTFCYRGENLNGECIARSLIDAEVREIRPSPVECIIDLGHRDRCVFAESTEARIVMTNAPDDAKILNARYSIDGMECRSGQSTCPMFCRGPGEEGNITCRFLLPSLRTSNDGDTTLQANFNFSVQYPAGPSSENIFTDEFVLRHSISVRKKYSPELQSCIEKEEEMDRQQSQVEGIRGAIIGFLAFVAALTAVMCALCHAPDPCGWCCKVCHLGLLVLTCVGGSVIGSIGTISSQIGRMRGGYSAMCRTNNFDTMVNPTSGMGNIGMSLIGAALSAACLIGTLGGGFSKFTGTSLSEIFGNWFGWGTEAAGSTGEVPQPFNPGPGTGWVGYA